MGTLRENYLATKPSQEVAALTPTSAPEASVQVRPAQPQYRHRQQPRINQEDACLPFCGKQVNVLVHGPYQYAGLLETVNIYSVTVKRADTGRSVVLFKNGMIALEETE